MTDKDTTPVHVSSVRLHGVTFSGVKCVHDCDYCGEIALCVNDEAGGACCRLCHQNIFVDRPEPEPPTDEQLENQYQAHLENPFGYDQIDPEQYVTPPEQEFDDFDSHIQCEDYYDDSMDGDHESGFTSIGWGWMKVMADMNMMIMVISNAIAGASASAFLFNYHINISILVYLAKSLVRKYL